MLWYRGNICYSIDEQMRILTPAAELVWQNNGCQMGLAYSPARGHLQASKPEGYINHHNIQQTKGENQQAWTGSAFTSPCRHL